MPAPNTSRPVHPCVVSVFEGTRGAEYSCWAYISSRHNKNERTPDLVTASGSSLRVYTLDESSGKLCQYLDTTLAGTICYLDTLPGDDTTADSLLVGFCGHPRLTIVTVQAQSPLCPTPTVLAATSLLDLTQALIDHSFGAVTPLEHDLVATSVSKRSGDRSTVAVVLGNGVAVACMDVRHEQRVGFIATEPYLLPLASLQASVQRSALRGSLKEAAALATAATTSSNTPSIATGFGDIISATFLPGYSEPTLVLLHSNPSSHGRVHSGRFGRPHWQPATRFGMLVTAISVTVAHQRSAVLWSVEVPADALELYRVGTHGCLVVCANSFVLVHNAGRVIDFLAVNGFVKSTCPARLLELLTPNPKPFPKLSVQLDGSALTFFNDSAALVSLRSGRLYVLQLPPVNASGSGNSNSSMCFMPLGRTLASAGNIASLISWPLVSASAVLYDKLTTSSSKEDDKEKDKTTTTMMSMGLVFCGSYVGDSTLLGYCLEMVDFAPWNQETNSSSSSDKKIKLESQPENDDDDNEGVYSAVALLPSNVSSELDNIMTIEEDALYDLTGETDNETTKDDAATTEEPAQGSKRKLPQTRQLAVVRGLTALDSILGLGPLGPSCEGPIVVPTQPQQGAAVIDSAVVPGTPALIIPCGYGSSGGVSIVTCPGRDERSILSEVDCLGADGMFPLRSAGLVLIGTKGAGVRVMKLPDSTPAAADNDSKETDSAAGDLVELGYKDCLHNDTTTKELFSNGTLLAVGEVEDGTFALAVSIPDMGQQYAVAILKEDAGKLQVVELFFVPNQDQKGQLLSITSMERHEGKVVFACTWAKGNASLIALDEQGIQEAYHLAGQDDNEDKMEMDGDDDDSVAALNAFYSSKRIAAVDLFYAPSNFFAQGDEDNKAGEKVKKEDTTETTDDDSEDDDLYNLSTEEGNSDSGSQGLRIKEEQGDAEGWKSASLFIAVCHQSGLLEIFAGPDMTPGAEPTPVWSAEGVGHGVSSIRTTTGSSCRTPRQHEVCVREIKFFFCGPTKESASQHVPGLSRPLCLAVETSAGDLQLYSADARSGPKSNLRFARVPLKSVARQSQEQTRFQAKLKRKGIVSGTSDQKAITFQYNKLYRFKDLSGQDGMLAAVARPVWLLGERGRPTAIVHRLRHASPAGGKAFPISGFCADLGGVGGFLTIHDRVGRFGSQRLTLYQEISNVFNAEGLLPGGGVCLERIPLGVTVRRIEFLDDASMSSRCLYAMLVSRELEHDMSYLNDDGMTREEREKIESDKDAAKIKRQVEADLGGFDVEQEWVEEIEREDCFQVDKEIGGAPPILQRAYALWIVDAANRWMVVDSYELGEFDHGMTMRVMTLTDFPEEPGSSNTSTVASEDMDSKLIIAVGVGIVDKNGEDVSSKGKVLLFDVAMQKDGDKSVELGLIFEKDIFHGPVTSLTCLSSEGKNRLVIGAGADINIEQWGNNKLTQVGFYRATMQVLDVFMFKNFLLLSDAYDSLYFLVWRESDKSLTLLSKDYDPLVVYAAGTISRGGSLTFVSHDDRQNLQFFQYAPREAAARGGNKLVCRADYHLGAQTAGFQNFPCRSSLWVNTASPGSTLSALKQQDAFFGRAEDDQRLGASYGTSDGGFGAIVPLSEPVYWRLAALQSVMANALENDCALSHRAWRLYARSFRRGGCRSTDRKKGVIDGDLVTKYMDLPLSDQEDLASSIGSSVALILDNLLELTCATSVI